jgi:hypothetical protein
VSRVFFDVGVSLDGFIAGPNRGPHNPLGDGGPAIHTWMYLQRRFHQNLGLGDKGETGADSRVLSATFDRSGLTSWANGCSKRGDQLAARTFSTAATRIAHSTKAREMTSDRDKRSPRS